MSTESESLAEATRRLESAARSLSGVGHSNHSNIHLNAGGIGVWVASTCCVVMLACNLFLLALYLDQQRQIASLNEYLSAIYMLAPSLKPEK